MFLILGCLLLGYLILVFFEELQKIFTESNFNWRWYLEDIIVAGLASLSLILIGLKVFDLSPQLNSIFLTVYIISLLFFSLFLIYFKIIVKQNLFTILRFYLLPINFKYIYWFIGIFSLYLIRALFKAKNFNEVVYIPSRYNTDIFLYLRRISIFLGEQTYLSHQYDSVNAQSILYDSPKLLISCLYAVFTNICRDSSIAATILTSLILTAIALKYIFLIKKSSVSSLFHVALVTLIFFIPAFSWLQDQFYLSNLLYLYLLIYTVEDLLKSSTLEKVNLKFTIAAIAVAGFYPSQLPFLALSTIILIVLSQQQKVKKIKQVLQIILLTVLTIIIFLPQYLATSEVVHHFNLTDNQHGVNFAYIPFWSLLSIAPKAGGFKVTIGSISLVIASLIINFLVTRYCSKKNSSIAQYLYLSSFLYLLYSLSFIIFPGSYRQGKFLVTYIIPLILFCFLKFITNIKKHSKIITIIIIILAIYVSTNSLDKQYKSHISHKLTPTINYIKAQNKPITIYTPNNDHRYYYLSYQLRNYPLKMISHCPSSTELTANPSQKTTIVIADSCLKNNSSLTDSNLIKVSF